jgi:hypothetical protein
MAAQIQAQRAGRTIGIHLLSAGLSCGVQVVQWSFGLFFGEIRRVGQISAADDVLGGELQPKDNPSELLAMLTS